MTALIMSTRYEHTLLVERGIKTHTLRLAREGQYAGKYQHGGLLVDAVFEKSGRVKWFVGCTRAIKASRNGPAVARVRIIDISEMLLGEVDDATALAEGIQSDGTSRGGTRIWRYADSKLPFGESGGWLSPRLAFEALWNNIHGDGAFDKNPRVWGLSFEYLGAEVAA